MFKCPLNLLNKHWFGVYYQKYEKKQDTPHLFNTYLIFKSSKYYLPVLTRRNNTISYEPLF